LAYGDNGIATYPTPNIDPRNKNYDWILQYCKAAFGDSRGYMPSAQLSIGGSLKMAEIDMYALGKQPVDKYKKMMSPGEPSDQSWRAIDWTPPAFMCKFREIAISKLLQKKFDLQAYAIDPLAKSEEDEHFNKLKVKIIAREAVEQAGGNPDDFADLRHNPGEPEDLEQLAIYKEHGYKHAMSIQAENAFNLIFEQNDIDEIRKRYEASLYDYGIGALTQWIDENGMTKLRAIDMQRFGSSFFEKQDGSDMVHWFELVPTYVADLAPYYSKEQLDDICKKVVGKNGNPAQYAIYNGFFNQSWNRFKVMVMQIKFLSWNDTIYKEEKDGRQNTRFGKSDYKNIQFLAVNKKGELEEGSDSDGYFSTNIDDECKGEATPKYIKSTRKVSYKASWIVDTDYMHDWGLRENQNRKLSSWWDTDLDIQLYAWNFSKMQFSGITERLMPFEDKACMAWFNLQNLSNKLIPYLINIDMTTVESAFSYGKAGTKGKPADVIDFVFSNFIVPWRSNDLLSRNPNYKPVSIEATGQLAAFAQRYEELQNTIEMMRQVSGMNEVTDGSTINPKNLNSTNNAMVEATNNAIYLISDASKHLLRKTADAIIQKVQIAVKLGKVEGYAKALGTNAVKFFNISPDISLHELGIFIDDAPTAYQREQLWNDVNIKESQGLLTIGDKVLIMSCRNLKEAAAILDYKIEKRKQQQHQQQMQIVQQQTEGNMQVAQATEQMKQQTIQMQGQVDMQLIIIEKQLEFKIEQMKKQMDLQGEMVQVEGRINVSEIAAEAKIISQQMAAQTDEAGKNIAAQSHIMGKAIDSDTAIEKQKIANKKPVSKAKS